MKMSQLNLKEEKGNIHDLFNFISKFKFYRGNNKGKKNKDKKKNEKQEEEAKEDKKDNAKEEKQEYSKLAILDLRTTPFLLAEGDILGVRDNSEERATQDDFQTITDIQNRERLEELKKFEKDNKGGKSKPSHNNDPLKILTDF